MTALELRHTIHRGSVLASGFVIDTALIPEATARARILRLSSIQLRVFRTGTCLIACFRDPVRVDAATAPGAPLVRQGRLLSAAPLDVDELEQLDSALEALVLSRDGRAILLHLDELTPEDISGWLDWSAFAVVEGMQPLGEIAPAPKTAPADAKADVRHALGVTPLTEDAQQVIEMLARGPSVQQGVGSSSLFTALRGLCSELWQALRGAGQRLRASERGAAHELAPPAASPAAASWLSRLRDGARQLATRALLWSRLAPLLGRRQAEYLARTLALFDANQLDEALRHAIPLTGSLKDALAPPTLGLPSPRTGFAIVPGRVAPSSVMGLGGALFEELRRRYRRAFERLVALGDVEKAAFVLAELLGDDAEAVSFLERQGRPELAAQIAEARNLPAGLVIRLWFLAGDKARAIRIARRTGEFGDAVLRLEQSHPLQGRALRLHWADYLAGTGAYAAAVDVIWPVAVARELALGWLERAISVGGPTGARMLARKAHVLPASFPEVRAAVLGWAEDEPAERGLLQALGLELTGAAPTAETRALARVAARRLLPYTEDLSVDRLVQSLLDICGDSVLRADVRAGRSADERPRGRIHVSACVATHVGLRNFNEDVCAAAFLDSSTTAIYHGGVDGDAAAKGVVLLVFDGYSGWDAERATHTLARAAAETVVKSLRKEFSTHDSGSRRKRRLVSALERANHDWFEEATSNPLHRGSSSTGTVATSSGTTLLLAHVGTTRAYLLRNGALVQLTRDHTLRNDYIESMHAQGKPPAEPEIDEAYRHVVTRALGTRRDVAIDLFGLELQRGDVLLLCSDGLWSVLQDNQIRSALIEHPTPKGSCAALLSQARPTGTPDNASVVVARFDGGGLSRGPSAVRCTPLELEARDEIPTLPDGRLGPVPIQRLSADRGALRVLDAAELPDGRLLVALGELGVWLLSARGKVLTRFAEPASQLVLSDHGDRALLLAPRGGSYRIARLDLISKRVRPWCDARFDGFAADFDGSTWFVARGDTVYAIDATSEDWEQLWKVENPGAFAFSIRRDEKSACVWFIAPNDNGELWTFELPSLTLRRRQHVKGDGAPLYTGATSARGKFAGWRVHAANEAVASALAGDRFMPLPVSPSARPGAVWVTDEWFALSASSDEGLRIHVLDAASHAEKARLQFEGAPNVGLRFQADHLVVFDTDGRVLVISLIHGSVVREYRIG